MDKRDRSNQHYSSNDDADDDDNTDNDNKGDGDYDDDRVMIDEEGLRKEWITLKNSLTIIGSVVIA